MAIRIRVTELIWLTPEEIDKHPLNERPHGDKQRAMFRQVADKFGFDSAFLVYKSERNDGRITLLDGHMRKDEVDAGVKYPCLLTDFTDD